MNDHYVNVKMRVAAVPYVATHVYVAESPKTSSESAPQRKRQIRHIAPFASTVSRDVVCEARAPNGRKDGLHMSKVNPNGF